MQIEILGTESLGVRGLCCVVMSKGRKVVIDPGVALGFRRHGLLPHPVQVAASERTRRLIARALEDATDIVISHYHGDHIPLVDANPYQLSVKQVVKLCQRPHFWAKGTKGISYNQAHRAKALAESLGRILPVAEGRSDGPLTFSVPVPHGERGGRGGSVMMTRLEEDGEVFVHASDIQMLNDTAIRQILAWQPNIVLASGPPIYLPSLTLEEQEDALHRTLRLAKRVDTLILDHHLMRSKKGERWLNHVSSLTGRKVVCAADFMGCCRNLLEAERVLWYKKLPVPEGWHRAYARGEIDVVSDWSDKASRIRVR
jgi:predicted metallo-beta-lactamase superfamily hydrolase